MHSLLKIFDLVKVRNKTWFMPFENQQYVIFCWRVSHECIYIIELSGWCKLQIHIVELRETDASSIIFLIFRYPNQKPARAQIQMMPIGTPRVPYRTPGEGTWQWVDLWNALVSHYALMYVINFTVYVSKRCWFTLCHISIDNHYSHVKI